MTVERPETDAYVTGQYRYWLTRTWDDRPPLAVVLCNPEDEAEDMTLPRLERLARQDFGGVLVMCLFARRGPQLAMMKAADPVGPENDDWLERLLERQVAAAQPIVLGWGVVGDFQVRGQEWARHAAGQGAQLLCVGETGSGCPSHPLFTMGEPVLRPYGAAP